MKKITVTVLLILLWPRLDRAEPCPNSFAYILQADAFAKSKSAAVEKLRACGRDWVVLDASFAENISWERADLDSIRSGHAERKILAYISIGEAEDYRSYWHAEWVHDGQLTRAAPAWLAPQNPEWKGNYRVKYWNADWQKITLAKIDDAMEHGFDGVYLDIVDGFETFEQDGENFIEDRINPETHQSYRRDMVDWVKMISSRARKKNSAARVIPQNASQLLAHADFREEISGIGLEDLFTNGNKLQPKSHTKEVLGDLKKLGEKPALVIEYSKSAERQALSKKLAAANGLVWLVTDRQLKTLGESGR